MDEEKTVLIVGYNEGVKDAYKKIIAKLRKKADYWVAYDKHGPRRALPLLELAKELTEEVEAEDG
mgnify:CR=1 FL=1